MSSTVLRRSSVRNRCIFGRRSVGIHNPQPYAFRCRVSPITVRGPTARPPLRTDNYVVCRHFNVLVQSFCFLARQLRLVLFAESETEYMTIVLAMRRAITRLATRNP
jgi:hypothetical protein